MAADLKASLEASVKARQVPAVGVIVLDKAGKTIVDESFGTVNANDETAGPFTNDSELHLWSCTKLITSVCILQLLEQGKIVSLDDPVAKYLPTDGNLKVLERIDENGKPVLRKPKTEMKLIHLMTHTSGLTYEVWEADKSMIDYRTSQGQPAQANESAKKYHDVVLSFDPGQKHHYGISVDHLGFIVEEISGLRLEEYMKGNIFEPLQMNKCGPTVDSDDFLRVHVKDGNGALTAVDSIRPEKDPWRCCGGHFVTGSLRDYTQFLVTLVNGGTHPQTGKQILKPETVRDYVFRDFIPYVGASPEGIGKCTKSRKPGASNAGDVGYSFRDSPSPRGWSCGLMMNLEDVPGGRRAGSGAWAGLGNTYYWIDPTAGIVGIIGTNMLPFLDLDSLELFEKVERLAYA